MSFEADIQAAMRDLGSKDWSVRFRSLEKLQELVAGNADDTSVWTREILVALHKPLLQQLKDLRSSIVRETGKLLVALSEVLGNSYSVLGRYLVETQLNVIGAGNKVITDYVDESLQAILQNAHIKGAIQVIEKTYSGSKSAVVREKCNLYMALVLENWDINALRKHEAAIKECIKHGLTDASGNARAQARRCFVACASIFPEVAEKLLRHTDHRTQKTLRALVSGKGSNATSPTGSDGGSGGGGGGGEGAVGGAGRPAAVKTTQRSRGSGKSPSSSPTSSPTQSPAAAPTRASPSGLGGSSRFESSTDGDDGATHTEAAAKKSPSYAHISPRFHGVQVDQNDLIAEDGARQQAGAGTDGGEQFAIGDRVWVEETATDGASGFIPATVRFTGHTEFAIGEWVGLELDGYEGRNDGSVQGIRYFSCEDGKGLFKRPGAVAHMTPQEILDNRATPAAAAVDDDGHVPISHQLGCQVLAAHRCHIDDVLATLRAEMEELADFETNSAIFDRAFVQNYISAVKRRVQQRIQLQKTMVQDIAKFEEELRRAPE